MSFLGLSYQGISTYLHSKRQKALWKAFGAMAKRMWMARNKISHFENSVIIMAYSVQKQ